MHERPILFDAQMVRAILAGNKTQTRRTVKLNSAGRVGRLSKQWHVENPGVIAACPYGLAGDRLWVRETWYCDDYRVQKGPYLQPDDLDVLAARKDGTLVYRADDATPYEAEQPIWRPSIHMPHWASRITLEITGVRMERLHAISYEDAIAEGIRDPATYPEFPSCIANGETVVEFCRRKSLPQRDFALLWESINGEGSWTDNPLVWVIEFRRIDTVRVAERVAA